MDSPFDVLGVDPDADEATVLRAYRRRVKETHPDQGGSTAEFKRVQEAYGAIQAGDASSTDVPAAEDINTGGGPGPKGNGAKPGGAPPGQGSTAAQDAVRMEYLDYEVAVEHGWEIDDDDLFERAAEADLDPDYYGRLLIQPGETILEAAEERGFSWPYACRGGACANCAVAVVDGAVEMPRNHVLSTEMVEEAIRLSCISKPASDQLKVVFNVKELPGLKELRLPAQQFR
ncbi:MAG: ferredoxin Fer [Halolamina sp.]|uniref:ferredoxin Fer n=1 Tax=Halolamina sp. TaxID=1940283 RepID=UPI002FC38496